MLKYIDDKKFKIHSPFKPTGDQPKAIDELVDGINKNKKYQVLQGATGTGKTFTMANIIERVQKPTLILVHNKTLAGQLYQEIKDLFPENRVGYFISNFDFYRPEAYIAKTDTYVEKEVQSNQEIEMLRASAVNSLLERRDTIIVASVASIYGLTSPSQYQDLVFSLQVGQDFNRKQIGNLLVQAMYDRNDLSHEKGTFSIKGDVIEIYPSYEENTHIRINLDFDEIESISLVDSVTKQIIESYNFVQIFPCYEHASTTEVINNALETIKQELIEREKELLDEEKYLEKERLHQRTMFDLEQLKEQGYCSGMENYSRHFDKRKEGEPPYTLLDYFPKDYLLIVDESHVTFPQIRAMWAGDRSRKEALVEYGFRLKSAFDNRPLTFDEFQSKVNQCIATSATPGDFELEQVQNHVVEQIIRPTGLLDPIITVKSNKNNPVYDLEQEIRDNISKNQRTLVVTLTINDAKNLYEHYKKQGIKCYYIEHDIKPLERNEIIYKLRKGIYDVLIGINLLREGLDMPEVSKIAILDADKEGFLRSTRSLIQIIGRAARNENGQVIMYADTISRSMDEAIKETKRRRQIQEAYNKEHNITPKTVVKKLIEPITVIERFKKSSKAKEAASSKDNPLISKTEILNTIKNLEKEMSQAAKDLDFEYAAELRDLIIDLKGKLK